MDIYAKSGTKVRFVEESVTQAQINYGFHDDPDGLLHVGQKYTVDHTDVKSSYTRVFLREFPGKRFNSVWFEKVAAEPEPMINPRDLAKKAYEIICEYYQTDPPNRDALIDQLEYIMKFTANVLELVGNIQKQPLEKRDLHVTKFTLNRPDTDTNGTLLCDKW